MSIANGYLCIFIGKSVVWVDNKPQKRATEQQWTIDFWGSGLLAKCDLPHLAQHGASVQTELGQTTRDVDSIIDSVSTTMTFNLNWIVDFHFTSTVVMCEPKRAMLSRDEERNGFAWADGQDQLDGRYFQRFFWFPAGFWRPLTWRNSRRTNRDSKRGQKPRVHNCVCRFKFAFQQNRFSHSLAASSQLIVV